MLVILQDIHSSKMYVLAVIFQYGLIKWHIWVYEVLSNKLSEIKEYIIIVPLQL